MVVLAPHALHGQQTGHSKRDALLAAHRNAWYIRAGADGSWAAEGRVKQTSDAFVQIGIRSVELNRITSIERRHRPLKGPLIGALVGAGLAFGLIQATEPFCGDGGSCPNWKTYLIGISSMGGLGAFGVAVLTDPEWRPVWPRSSE